HHLTRSIRSAPLPSGAGTVFLKSVIPSSFPIQFLPYFIYPCIFFLKSRKPGAIWCTIQTSQYLIHMAKSQFLADVTDFFIAPFTFPPIQNFFQEYPVPG